MNGAISSARRNSGSARSGRPLSTCSLASFTAAADRRATARWRPSRWFCARSGRCSSSWYARATFMRNVTCESPPRTRANTRSPDAAKFGQSPACGSASRRSRRRRILRRDGHRLVERALRRVAIVEPVVPSRSRARAARRRASCRRACAPSRATGRARDPSGPCARTAAPCSAPPAVGGIDDQLLEDEARRFAIAELALANLGLFEARRARGLVTGDQLADLPIGLRRVLPPAQLLEQRRQREIASRGRSAARRSPAAAPRPRRGCRRAGRA